MTKLVLLRHGESVWNKENRFTGWTDVDLSPKGVSEAQEAGKILKNKGFVFDLAFTSVLIRAERTLEIVLDEMDLKGIEVFKSWRLNERHYGTLQGLNKAEIAKQYGEEQVAIWRRSYSTPPAFLFHKGESLKDTVERFLPYWTGSIEPFLRKQKRIIIVAHGNTLRALVKYLDGVSEEDIVKLEIPTGIPLVYEFDETFKAVKSYYLAK